MSCLLRVLLPIALLLVTAHRLPAPISEIPESTATAKPKAKAKLPEKAKTQSANAENESRSRSVVKKASPRATLFAGTWTGPVTARAYVFLAGNVAFSSTYLLQISPNEKTISMEERRDAGAYAIRQSQFACRREGDSLVWSYQQDGYITGMCTLRFNSSGTAELAGERIQHNWGLGKDIFKITGTLVRQ
jgi:hypothetical protein